LRRLTIAGLATAVYGLLMLAAVWAGARGAAPVGAAVALAAPLGALAAAALAVRALPPAAAGPWTVLGLAALAAASAQVLGLLALTQAGHAAPVLGASQVLLGAGIAWTILQRDRGRQAEIALDVVLIVGAVTVGLLRWSPALAQGPATFERLVLPVAAVCAVAFATVLLASLRSSEAGDTAATLFAGTLLLATPALPSMTGLDVCCAPVDGHGLAAIAGWGFLAYTGLRSARGGAGLFLPAAADPAGARLRQSVAPIVALLVAVMVVDAGLRAPLAETTAVALGLLCVALATRVSRLLETTKDHAVERRQLAQSRALIEVSTALAGAKELDETLSRVVEWTRRLLGAKGAVLELLSADQNTLEVRAAAGFPRDFLGLRFDVDRSFTGWVVRHGTGRITLDSSRDPDIQPQSRRFLGRMPVAAVPLSYHGRILGVLSCVRRQAFDRDALALLGALADQAAVAIENARLFQQVNLMSKTDPLTGLANRRQLEHDLAREFAAAQRGRPLVAVMFDLNEFKAYNDRHGHLAGDDALRVFGEVLGHDTRMMNLAARFGGDEFVALLSDTDEVGARVFSQRIRRKYVHAMNEAGLKPIGVSVGCAAYDPSMARAQDLIGAADRALYESKARRSTVG
jgi:diguanylate cyclase (GGDEF)-like protein